MSKVKENNVKDAEVVETADKSSEMDPKEVIETLRTQFREHSQQADHHRMMATKAQGALEVLLQLHPEEEDRSNGEVVEG